MNTFHARNGLYKIATISALTFSLAACSTDPTQRKVGVAFADTAITAKVKAALAGDPDVKGSDVNVETFRGTVQLSGFVSTSESARRAADLARRVEGVRDVQNGLSVK